MLQTPSLTLWLSSSVLSNNQRNCSVLPAFCSCPFFPMPTVYKDQIGVSSRPCTLTLPLCFSFFFFPPMLLTPPQLQEARRCISEAGTDGLLRADPSSPVGCWRCPSAPPNAAELWGSSSWQGHCSPLSFSIHQFLRATRKNPQTQYGVALPGLPRCSRVEINARCRSQLSAMLQ